MKVVCCSLYSFVESCLNAAASSDAISAVAGRAISLSVQTLADGSVYQGEVKGGARHGRGVLKGADGSSYEGDFVDGRRQGRGIFKSIFGCVYKGDFKKDQYHGFGSLKFANGSLYEGEFKKDKYHGRGGLKYANGNVYEGEFKRGERHGRGVLRSADGSVYEGEFKRGKYHGLGMLKHSNGIVYEGEFKRGQYDGHGQIRAADGSIYTGQFVQGKFRGRGMLHVDGEVYEGDYVDGCSHGHGVLRFSNGSVYEGDFVKGDPCGQGILRYANGDVYEGGFVEGVKQGPGIYRCAYGAVYEGTYANDRLQGKGIYRLPNGSCYEGDFVDDRFHGKGVYRFACGDVYKGAFQKDRFHGYGVYKIADGPTFQGQYENGVYTYGDQAICKEFVDGKRHGEVTYLFDVDLKRGIRVEETLQARHGILVDLDRDHIGDFWFLCLLFGIRCGGAPYEYPLRILSDYLIDYFKNDAAVLYNVIRPLAMSANCDLDMKQCMFRLKRGHSCLVVVNTKNHGLGLYLIPSECGTFVECEIYNSGEGLKHHEKQEGSVESKVKFQTMKKIVVPMEQFPSNFTNNFMVNSIDEFYEVLLKTPGAVVKPLDQPVWQSEQAAGNCPLEWIFAYLKNKLPNEVYCKLRKDLFRDCLTAALARPTSSHNNVDLLKLERVKHKLEKLGLCGYFK